LSEQILPPVGTEAIGDFWALNKSDTQTIDDQQQRLAIVRSIKDRSGEAKSLNNLGNIDRSQGDYTKAIDYYQQSLAILQTIKDRWEEGAAFPNLGLSLVGNNQLTQAESCDRRFRFGNLWV
jgi:tetratricopeptide (TPR) repeat protein